MLDINRAMTTLRRIKSAKDIEIEKTLIDIKITDASRDQLEQMIKDEFLARMSRDLQNAFSSNDLGVVLAMLEEDCVTVNVTTINDFHILDQIRVTDNIQKPLEEIIRVSLSRASNHSKRRYSANSGQNFFIRQSGRNLYEDSSREYRY